MSDDKKELSKEERNNGKLIQAQAAQIGALQAQLAEVTQILMKTANKKALQRFFSKKVEGKKVNISLFDSTVVTGWKLLTNEVRAEKNKGAEGIRENQLVRLFLDDGSEKGRAVELAYIDFVNDLQKVEVEVDEVSVNAKTGKTIYKLTHEGKQYSFDPIYLN